ncbi:MAG: hypothetical protein AB1657_04885 [Candidatus Micrarchaeota archaeon]
MGDVEQDMEAMKRIHASGSAKLRAASSLNEFMVKVFKERIRRRHPHADAGRVLKILREELSYGRRVTFEGFVRKLLTLSPQGKPNVLSFCPLFVLES